GITTSMISQFPNNDMGEACLKEVRSFGVNSDHILRNDARMGQYFLEAGSNLRSGKVIYDREHSAFTQLKKGDVNWEVAFEGYQWFHMSGITPALSEELAEISLQAVKVAKKKGLKVSFDFNYREGLWAKNNLNARKVLGRIVENVNVLMASSKDCKICLDMDATEDKDQGRNFNLTQKMFDQYPNLDVMVSTFRNVTSADDNSMSAISRDRRGYNVGREFRTRDIVDRIGSGDAFAAGLIYSIISQKTGEETLNFATAAAALKHSIVGDINRVSESEINDLLNESFTGQINR
ncbi:MAG: sugar kinase, partial [Kordiimonadaceae bacterium]|nr:sugar kinase [Kordiimonadaceae bacterium]